MIAELLIHQFDFNQLLIVRGLADVTHEESLRLPQAEGNCINWIVGHIVTSRANLEAMLGAKTYWTRSQCEPYIPGKPFDVAQGYRIEDLKRAVEESLVHLKATIESISQRIDEPSGPVEESKAGEIATFVCHEAYHAGQIHMLRRTFGKPGLFG